jgi:hypothetical protein
VAGRSGFQRPRVRTTAGEVALPTFQTMAAPDPLDRRVVEQMLVGVATRQHARSLRPVGPEMKSRGTSKSAVSRRFVAFRRVKEYGDMPMLVAALRARDRQIGLTGRSGGPTDRVAVNLGACLNNVNTLLVGRLRRQKRQ